MQEVTANYNKAVKSWQKPLTFLAILLFLGLGGLSLYRLRSSSSISAESPPSASLPQIRTVTALGRLEPQGEIIAVSAASTMQSDRLKELWVKEGDRVKEGQTIAILESYDSAKATLRQAEDKVVVNQAKLSQIKAGAKQGEIDAQKATIERLKAELRGSQLTDQAKISRLTAQLNGEKAEQIAKIERLEAELGNAEREFERYRQLAKDGAISESDLDRRQLTLDQAKKQLNEVKATFNKTVATLTEEIRENQAQANETVNTLTQQIQAAEADLDRIAEVRPVDIAVAEAEVREAQSAVSKAKVDLERSIIKAPQNGQILDILTHQGEKIASEGIVRMGQTNQMEVVAEIYESDIYKIQVGQGVEITSNALETTLQGTVERIGLEIKRQEVINTDPAANIDAKVVEVRINLDQASRQQVTGLTNLLVTVTIQIGNEP
ncbi:MAG: ABC exporter membrane fusion protein [Microcystaceae cyanobacterium]